MSVCDAQFSVHPPPKAFEGTLPTRSRVVIGVHCETGCHALVRALPLNAVRCQPAPVSGRTPVGSRLDPDAHRHQRRTLAQ